MRCVFESWDGAEPCPRVMRVRRWQYQEPGEPLLRHFLWLDKVRSLVFFVVFVDVMCIFSASVRCEPVFFFFFGTDSQLPPCLWNGSCVIQNVIY